MLNLAFSYKNKEKCRSLGREKGGNVASHHINRVARDMAVEQSLDAAIELSEVISKKRSDAPALSKLALLLMGTQPDETTCSKRELLSNSQLASLSFRASVSNDRQPSSTQDLDPILELLVKITKAGLSNITPPELLYIREFCLGLNRELVLEVANRIPEPIVVRSKAISMALHGD